MLFGVCWSCRNQVAFQRKTVVWICCPGQSGNEPTNGFMTFCDACNCANVGSAACCSISALFFKALVELTVLAWYLESVSVFQNLFSVHPVEKCNHPRFIAVRLKTEQVEFMWTNAIRNACTCNWRGNIHSSFNRSRYVNGHPALEEQDFLSSQIVNLFRCVKN